MSEVAPLDPRDLQIEALKQQIAALQKPSRTSVAANAVKKVARGLWAAVASTDAVKQEKSLAATIIVRLAISAGAADGTVKLAQLLLKTAGWS